MTTVPPASIQFFPTPTLGIVDRVSDRTVRVAWQATTWFAELYASESPAEGSVPLALNQSVTVLGRRGVTLLIKA